MESFANENLPKEVKQKMDWLKETFETQGINAVLDAGKTSSERCSNPSCTSETIEKLQVSTDL
jgi:hypothetical protein